MTETSENTKQDIIELEGENLMQAININELNKLFQDYNSIDNINDLADLFTKNISSVCKIVESDILIYDKDKVKLSQFANLNTDSSKLKQRIEYLVEEGIIDWAIEENIPQIILDLHSQMQENLLNILLIPFVFNDKSLGIYVAITENDRESFDSGIVDFIKLHSNFVSSCLQTINLSEKVSSYRERLMDLNTRFMNILPLTSYGDISLTILKEITLPLQIIESNLSLIESGIGNFNRRLEIIKQQIKSVDEIINLLDEISAGAKSSKLENINVFELTNETINIISTQLKSNATNIEFIYDSNELRVRGNKIQLQFVLIQLINFLSVNHNETKNIYINLSENNNRNVVITIRDDSKEFEFDNFDVLLELIKNNSNFTDLYQYFQSIKSILKINNGRLEANSNSNLGTVFRIYLISTNE